MSSLTPILSIPFLLSLGISLILIGFVGVFFYQKITEQNHKISSMVDLISTMAEELNYIRSRVQSAGASGGENISPNILTTQQIPLVTPQTVKTDLINVSDDDSDFDSDCESETEDESDDESSEEEEDESEEEQENVRVINISDSLLHHTEKTGEVEEIPSENNDDIDDLEDEDDSEDEKSSTTSEEESKVEVIKLDEIMEEPLDFEPVLDIDTTLLKSIHMTFPTDENIDYKKLSLNKLRQIVSEKNLSSDSSKLKKQELLKLLGVE